MGNQEDAGSQERSNPKLVIAEGPVFVDLPVMISGTLFRSRVGKYLIIHPGIFGAAGSETVIDRYSQIAAGCHIGIGGHPTDWLSSHIFQYRNDFHLYPEDHPTKLFQKFSETAPTRVGNDVWIGTNTLIKSGGSVGDDAVVGAGSVVTHDVPPYAIARLPFNQPAECVAISTKAVEESSIARETENWKYVSS